MTPPQETETPLTDAAEVRYFDWKVNCREREHSIRNHAILNAVPDGWDTARTLEKRAILAETKLAEMRAVLERLLNTLREHGDMDEGCYYYNGKSASELESPIREATTILSKP